MWRVVLIGGLVLGLTGCAPPEKDPGVEAYKALAMSIRRGDAAGVWASLTPESQVWLGKRLGLPADANSEQVVAVLGVRPGWQFEIMLPRKAKASADPQTAGTRIVEGPLAGQMWRIPTRLVDGRWGVDLANAKPLGERSD